MNVLEALCYYARGGSGFQGFPSCVPPVGIATSNGTMPFAFAQYLNSGELALEVCQEMSRLQERLQIPRHAQCRYCTNIVSPSSNYAAQPCHFAWAGLVQ
jgi:hypothetical protein